MEKIGVLLMNLGGPERISDVGPFLYNLFASARLGKKAEKNPWKANSLEWQTPQMPPEHGNWGKELPKVYRWPYDFSVPGAKEDYIPQNQPPSEIIGAKVEKT